MKETITVTGIVLFAAPVGDYDKRMVILTKELGKITVFARGARKSTSPFLAAANPFVMGSFQIYEGRTAYTLHQVNAKEYFTELAAKQPGVYYGFYFLEIAEYFGREGNRETSMLNLLYVTLKALLHENIPNPLVRAVFELKTMVINGEYPSVFECVECGSKEKLRYISEKEEGCVCLDCASSIRDRREISGAALYAFQYIISVPMEKLYTFTLKPEVLREVTRWSNRYMERHTDRKFKSLDILEMMES